MLVKRKCIYTPKGKNRPLHIWLPQNYKKSGKRYPVLYFFDGHNLFSDKDATYGKCWGFREFFEAWDMDMILVGMECGHEGNERLSEYLPYPADDNEFFRQFTPMGDDTFRWLLEVVKPYVDANFPTLPDREHTGIGGSSMGGLMAIYGGAHYNEYFSRAACVSSAIGACMKPMMEDLLRCEIRKPSRFYLSWGTREARRHHVNRGDRSSPAYHGNKAVADLLKTKKAAVKLHCQVGGGHCEADWEKQIPLFMDWLWK